MENFEAEIMSLLKIIEEQINEKLENHFKEFGLTAVQGGLLIALYNMGPLKISELSTILQKGNNTISQLCDRLEKIDLVIRKKDDYDRRVVTVHLTDVANEKIKEANEKKQQIASFTQEDQETILKGLRCILKYLGGEENE